MIWYDMMLECSGMVRGVTLAENLEWCIRKMRAIIEIWIWNFFENYEKVCRVGEQQRRVFFVLPFWRLLWECWRSNSMEVSRFVLELKLKTVMFGDDCYLRWLGTEFTWKFFSVFTKMDVLLCFYLRVR